MKLKTFLQILCLITISVLLIGCGGGTSGTDGGSALKFEGKVFDETGAILSNIQITILETGDSSVSDEQGEFKIKSMQNINSASILISDGNRERIAGPLTVRQEPDALLRFNIRLNIVDFSVSIEELTVTENPILDNPSDSPSQPDSSSEHMHLIFMGRVIDQNDRTISGAVIYVENSSDITDSDGRFKLNAKSDATGSVSVRVKIGGKTKTLTIRGLPLSKSTVSFNLRVQIALGSISPNSSKHEIQRISIERLRVS